MPQTREEKNAKERERYAKNRGKESARKKKYREENREKESARGKKYREENKEKEKERHRKYYEENREVILGNKERISISNKKYYEENKEKEKERHRKYNKTPNGIKSWNISHWKKMGVKGDLEEIYEGYLKSTNCEKCGIEYGKKGDGEQTYKCLDHSHETGEFRNYLCCSCNIQREENNF